jgi:hypothetical protein
MDPSATIGSIANMTMAAGAVPSRIASARTLLDELDPRPEGITKMRPPSSAPR